MQTSITAPIGRAARFAAWDRALRRAIANNLAALALPDGAYAISSSTDEDHGYIVDRHGSCQCAAAQHGNSFCQHAALAAALGGFIPWPVFDQPVEVAAVEVVEVPADTVDCGSCNGMGRYDCGYLDRISGGWRADWRECRICHGTGQRPARRRAA